MQSTTFNSTQLASGTYEERTQTLTITFKNGAKYEYYHVSKQTWVALKTAASAGSYFSTYIKGSYNFQKIG